MTKPTLNYVHKEDSKQSTEKFVNRSAFISILQKMKSSALKGDKTKERRCPCLELKGCLVDKIIFEAENFIVVLLEHNGQRFTAISNFPLMQGQKIDASGEWFTHKKYGKQFKIFSTSGQQQEYIIDYTKEDIEIFLRHLKGIGPKRSQQIVKAFGVDALNVLKTNPFKLTEIGIPENIVESAYNEFVKYSEMNELKLLLFPVGVTLNTVRKIYGEYGRNAVFVLKKNPYKIADDIPGFGFIKADKISQKLGIKEHDPIRIQAAVKYIFKNAEKEGHICLPQQILKEKAIEFLGFGGEILEENIRNLITDKELIEDNEFIYTKDAYIREKFIAEKLKRMITTNPTHKQIKNAKEILQTVSAKSGIIYTKQQLNAVKEALLNKVLVITGGPGVGKTTIIKAVLEILNQNGWKVELTAPTGKAAKRLTEATGYEAKTIHRLLDAKYNEKTRKTYFAVNEANPLDVDAVIVDEMSMVGNDVMYFLLQGLKDETKLILVGDADQLPSVEAGNILGDIIESGVVPVVRLTEIHRQSSVSSIIYNAQKINMGSMPMFNLRDFIYDELLNPEHIVKIYMEELSYGKTPKDIQVLIPIKKGDLGVKNINFLIQQTVNPPSERKKEIKYGDTIYRTGDKVIQTENNYEKMIFNGEEGEIEDAYIDKNYQRHLIINFNGNTADIVEDEIQNIELAYATTVHKSQGSEYDTVILIVTTKHFIMLKRNLLYTAVTRAKEKVIILGERKAVWIAVKNIDMSSRYTLLKERLQKIPNKVTS